MPHGERFNTISHLIGIALASFGAALLLYLAMSKNDLVEIIAFAVYAVTTVGLYWASTLYHGSHGEIKNLFRRMDYIGIYLKIAGTYTPFSLLILRGTVGWAVLTAVWVLAAIGILHEFNLGRKTRRYSIIIYGVMALSLVPVIKHVIDALPPLGFALLLAGFVSYGIGFYFYINDERIKHGHGLWHVGVLGGTLFQYLCLLIYAT